MLTQLYDELSAIDWQYHALEAPAMAGAIVLKAVSMDPQGVLEVMRIREIAEEHHMHAKWDGRDIMIAQREM